MTMLDTPTPNVPETLTDAAAPPAHELPPTARDTQRAALRDLMALSRETSLSESEIQQRHNAQLEETRVTYDRTTKDFDYRLESLRRQIGEKAIEKQQQIDAQQKTELGKLKSQLVESKNDLTAKFDASKADLKRKFDQAAWLADSVLEAAEAAAQQEYRRDVDRHNDQNDALSATEKQAAALAEQYGITPEPADEGSLILEQTLTTAQPTLDAKKSELETLLARMKAMGSARLFVGAWPVLIVLFLCAIAAAVVQFTQSPDPLVPQWKPLAYAVGGTFAGVIVLGLLIKMVLNKKIRATYDPLRTAIVDVRIASSAVNQNAAAARALAVTQATEHRNGEVDATRQKLQPQQQKLIQIRDAGLRQLQEEQKLGVARIEQSRKKLDDELAVWKQRQDAETLGRVRGEQDKLKAKLQADLAGIGTSYEDRRKQLQKRWFDGLATIQAPIGDDVAQQTARTNWPEFEKTYSPQKQFPETITLGSLSIDMQQISAGIPRDGDVAVNLPERFSVPAMIGFPSQASVMIQTEPEGREDGLRALQLIMTKVMTQVPAGRARFTIIDPVGLGQSFAGFMHLADHDDQLVTNRIWTTPEQIDQRLTDLTEHMETVIQKYLRNEFATIDEYNAQAGELAEPYRFLVIADFPSGFEGESWRRLLSIARSGARCGVYTLILRDTRKSLPADLMIEDLESSSTNLVRENGRFIWRDEVYQQFPLTLDLPPDEDTLTKIVHKVGRAAKEAARVEVDFTTIAPKQSDFWTQSAAAELAVPIGKMGATRLQYFRCGRGMAQHSLVAGKTGSGKSTLLHAMITNLAMWYSPDEVEFYLIDFKKGVEFKTYADFGLPHARAIAVESDREFGLSVLQRIDAELVRRGEMFRKAGTQDLGAYRKKLEAEVLPRVMLIIDEFQEFFTEDDKLAQDAQLLLDRLVRQGRAFGIHVFLGSQTIGGSGGLARSTISQMGIRIALQCNEADSQLILGDNNSAARLLTRPGEAIFNDAGGAVEHNSPFQVAWLADHRKEQYLGWINDKLKAEGTKRKVIPPLVFEGNQPADITKNQRLLGAFAARDERRMSAPVAWVGDPVAIKDPTGVTFRRQSGSNVLIIGQVDEQALSTLAAMVLSLATQLPRDKGRFIVLDGTPADSFLSGQLPAALEGIPNEINFVDYRQVDDEINALTDELARRREDDQGNHPGVFLVINGLQRYRTLRKGEEEGFSFSVSDEPKKASASKQFVDLIREGPSVGIHVISWIDTLASIERTFERGLLREFDNRILFQMSSNDSSNLIDSPVANRLGFNRGLAYSEEQGVMEKFRPYGLAPKDWLKQVTQSLNA